MSIYCYINNNLEKIPSKDIENISSLDHLKIFIQEKFNIKNTFINCNHNFSTISLVNLLNSNEKVNKSNIQLTHWSYFENWDPYRNYLIAKEYCGLREAEDSNSGTFTNFSQNDQALYALHTYLMYLKFGFGRANQDACIEVRRGAMGREQAVNLVRLYDGHYPEEFVGLYLDYYQMTQPEFDEVIDRYANKKLFEKLDGRWKPRFLVI
jgi:hypothetical protein